MSSKSESNPLADVQILCFFFLRESLFSFGERKKKGYKWTSSMKFRLSGQDGKHMLVLHAPSAHIRLHTGPNHRLLLLPLPKELVTAWGHRWPTGLGATLLFFLHHLDGRIPRITFFHLNFSPPRFSWEEMPFSLKLKLSLGVNKNKQIYLHGVLNLFFSLTEF